MSFKEVVSGDQEIIDSILNGSKAEADKALKYLYKTYFSLIRGFLLKNNAVEEDVADIFQETIIILYNHIKEGKFRRDSSIKTYLYAVSRNLWLKELRKHPRQMAGIMNADDFDALAEEIQLESNQEENIRLIRELVRQLGSGCRDLLIDYYYGQYSMKEIMIKYGLGSEHSAKTKKYRCMQKLMAMCKKKGLKRS